MELRTEELAADAMKLDRINLGGREINVGRPRGYIEPPPGTVRDPNEVCLAHVPFVCQPRLVRGATDLAAVCLPS